MAEKAGFEPAVRYKRTLAFQASALNHSATSPNVISWVLQWPEDTQYIWILRAPLHSLILEYKVLLFYLTDQAHQEKRHVFSLPLTDKVLVHRMKHLNRITQ